MQFTKLKFLFTSSNGY